jgi:uncharacterized repeat protein (TIGR01451 family)
LAGAPLTYSIEVSNIGPSKATGVSLTDYLPGETAFVTASPGCTAEEDATGKKVTCNLGSLEVGASKTVTITVATATDASGVLLNRASVTATEHDPTGANNSQDQVTAVEGIVDVYIAGTPPGDEWSNPETTTSPCGRDFQGEFGNETVTLKLENLQPHTRVSVSFSLFIIRSWDGNTVYWPPREAGMVNPGASSVIGPDRWQFQADGETLLHTTFANWNTLGFRQAYPGPYPVGDYTAQTGASEVNSLCYGFGDTSLDSVYHMSFTFEHTGSDLRLDFSAMGLQSIDDESWGLENVMVSLSAGAELKPNKIYLPLVAKK